MKTLLSHRLSSLAWLAMLATCLASSAPAQLAPDSPLAPLHSIPPVAHTEAAPENELRLGGFLVSGVTTRIQLGTAQGSVGSQINFADMLGGDTSVSVFRADARWGISGPHSLEASWYDLDLHGHRTLTANLTFGGKDYMLGTTVDSRYRTNVYKLVYGYAFYRDARHEVTGLVGAHIMQVQTSISATSLGQFENFSATAPLPSFGVAWKARWTDLFSTRLAVQYFGLSLEKGKYSGHFNDVFAAA